MTHFQSGKIPYLPKDAWEKWVCEKRLHHQKHEDVISHFCKGFMGFSKSLLCWPENLSERKCYPECQLLKKFSSSSLFPIQTKTITLTCQDHDFSGGRNQA